MRTASDIASKGLELGLSPLNQSRCCRLIPSACWTRCCLTSGSQHRVRFAMPFEQLLALAMLALVGSFTPGPNNMIATVTGANHGFRAALPHIFGVPFGFASMLIAGAVGVAALAHLSIYRSLDQVGRHYLSAFHRLAVRAPECDRRRLRRDHHETAFVLAVCCVSVCQSEGMDARGGDRGIVHDKPCDVRQHCSYCHRVFAGCNGQSLSPERGLAPPCGTGSASARECEFLTLRWACFWLRPHCGSRRCEGEPRVLVRGESTFALSR
jgi:hypothetical protein